MTTTTTAAPAPRKRRRRRRRTNQLLSQRLVTEVNQKKRTFLREVSAMLTDALGFDVRVTLAPKKLDHTPDMRRAARMTKKQARRQMADSMSAPVVPGSRILPVTKHADGTHRFNAPKVLEEMINEPLVRHRAKAKPKVASAKGDSVRDLGR
jgi:hypothetical protein